MSLSINDVFRDFNTAGVPTSGDYRPNKKEIRQLLKEIAGGTAAVGDYRGPWDGEADYIATDMVEDGGSIWYALADSTNVTPVEGATWTLFLPGATAADGTITEVKLTTSLANQLPLVVSTYAAMKAANLARWQVFHLTDAKRGGLFRWDASDLSATLTKAAVTSTSVDSGTDTITKATHGLLTGECVIATTAVNGLSLNTRYYVIKVTNDTFKLASSYANAKASSAFNLTGTTNFSVKPLLDPVEAIYVIATGDAIDGSDGAIVRESVGAVNVLWADVDITGATQCDEEMEGLFSIGRNVLHDEGDILVDGSINIKNSGFTVFGRGRFLKDGSSGAKPMFTMNDYADRVTWRDLLFDGAKASFSVGNGVPAILGHRNTGTLVTGCSFENFIDVGVKLRMSQKTTIIGNKFYNMGENGCEFRWYQNDPRTAAAWVGAIPTTFGDLVVIGNHFELIGRIENQASGLVDGCGVTFDIGADAARVGENVTITGNSFIDCLRAVFCENNGSSRWFANVTITGNTISGRRQPTAAYTKVGVGLINVVNFVCSNNTIYNVGNYDTVSEGSANSGIVVSSNSRDGAIIGNTITDDTGNTYRMNYGILITLGERIRIDGNMLRGQSTNGLEVTAGTDISLGTNPGA